MILTFWNTRRAAMILAVCLLAAVAPPDGVFAQTSSAPSDVRVYRGTATPTVTPTPTPTPTPPPPPPPSPSPGTSLTPSGSIVVANNGQVIENVRVNGTITINGKSNVTIRNVEVLHPSGHGIVCQNSPGLRLDHVAVAHSNAPARGPHASEQNNLNVINCPDLLVEHARFLKGSTGAWIVDSPRARLSYIECRDARGPFPRGQCVQFDKSDNAILEDFSYEHVANVSWEEDNISSFGSSNITIRRGLIDGNNSPSGVGVMIELLNSASGALVEDVDAIRMGNGAFSGYPATNVIFRRTRARQNVCSNLEGRGTPMSNALVWAGMPGSSSNLRIENSSYFALCNPGNLVWDRSTFSLVDIRSADFTPRSPIRVDFPWE